jgi:uncharacterized protein involved in tolerance to divalent cations
MRLCSDREIVQMKLAASCSANRTAAGYWWRGSVHRTEEETVVLRTRMDLVESITSVVRSVHPHKVPEVAALEVRLRTIN